MVGHTGHRAGQPTVDVPLFHMAVRVAAVVDEPGFAAPQTSVNHQRAIELKAIVVLMPTVYGRHALDVCLQGNHVTHIFQDECPLPLIGAKGETVIE